MDSAERLEVRTFVESLLDESDDRDGFGDEEALISSGRLDSLAVVKIVMFLETRFAVDFARVEFDPERFDTVVAIGAMIEESRAAT